MGSDRIKAVANDIGDEAVDAAKNAASSGRDAVSKANDVYGQARERLRDATEGLPDRASDAVAAAGRRVYHESRETVGRQVAKQPIEALFLAGAIGYLVGWASNRS